MFNPLKDKTEYGWHFEQNVYLSKGITRALKAGGGSGNIPKVIISNIIFTVEDGKDHCLEHFDNIEEAIKYAKGYDDAKEIFMYINDELYQGWETESLL